MLRTGRLTIALAGGAGSGKTTVARALAELLKGQASGFGDYVRQLAIDAGEGTDRQSLQQLGQSLVTAGAPAFVRDFMTWASPPSDRPFIVEGVRHAAVDDALRAWALTANRGYILILLDTEEAARAARRSAGNAAGLRAIDDHPVERETIENLPSVANAIVSGVGSIDAVVAAVLEAVREWMPEA